jgi:hypothetical protein
MDRPVKLYSEAVAITYDYLGPAADRFLTRQIRNHLNISPSDLKDKNLLELIDWIRLAMMILTHDEHLVDEYVRRLTKLAQSHGSEKLAQS